MPPMKAMLAALAVTACSQPTSAPPSTTPAQQGVIPPPPAVPRPLAAMASATPAAAPATPASQTPLIIELASQAARAARLGGSGVVLLADPASPLNATRNLALCEALFEGADKAPPAPASGDPAQTRPIYWLTHEPTPGDAGTDRCPARLDAYDYQRALTLKRKLGLNADGPLLIVERADHNAHERIAAVIDLSRVRAGDIAPTTHYFRDAFAQAPDAWDAQRFAPAAISLNMAQYFGHTQTPLLPPRLVRAARNVGCPLTDLRDGCTSSAP